LAQLNKHRHRPLTLVSAPAGYGKSALISSWLETNENPAAWLSLSKSDSDLRTFLSYFIAAVHEHFPDDCQNTFEKRNFYADKITLVQLYKKSHNN
jgi:LuxR family maltose regulon positive regulatory protein